MVRLLPFMWASVVLIAASRIRPLPIARVAALGSPSLDPCDAGARRRRDGVLPIVGLAMASRVPARWRPLVTANATAAGAAALFTAIGTLAAGPLAGLLAGVAAAAVPAATARAATARRLGELADDLPDVVDLLVVAVGAGCTVRSAVERVAAAAPGPFGAQLRTALAEVAHGMRLADALERIPVRCGEVGRPLVTALTDAERYGSPLLAVLDVLSSDARDVRRRRAETAARRLPVLLLFPLVLCILPAFALLTVAPMLAGGLSSLGL